MLWDDQLWIQVPVQSRHPAFTRTFSRATLDRLRELDPAKLDLILSSEHTPPVKKQTLERRDQVLAAAKKGELIP